MAKAKTIPLSPSLEEQAKHNLTHLPFRSWCRHCVMGKALEDPHKRQPKAPDDATPLLRTGYTYITRAGSKTEATCLTVHDSKTNGIYCTLCLSKGNDYFVAKWCDFVLDETGHDKHIIQLDQEPALVELWKEVKKNRRRPRPPRRIGP